MKRWLALMLVALLLPVCAMSEENPSVTIMIYVCGSDLESEDGSATEDINEMLSSGAGENINIVLETGGSTTWQNDTIQGGTSQRHLIGADGFVTLETTAAKDMTDPQTLMDFLLFCRENYQADRNLLIFWDHGGGALYGFGEDENFPGGNLTIDEIAQAMHASGMRFDMVGFDACLMATVETALAVSPYADYLLASEETEPGTGWYYTNWLSSLAAAPDMDMPSLCQRIIDDYIELSVEPEDIGTLSVIDLGALAAAAPDALNQFALEAEALIQEGDFARLSKARSGAKSFGYDEHDMVDLIDLILRLKTDNAQELAASLQSAILYRRDTGNIRAASGLSIYFPYHDLPALDDMLAIYRQIGWSEEYSNLTQRFANIKTGGQTLIDSGAPFASDNGGGFLSSLLESEETTAEAFAPYADYGWFSQEAIDNAAGYIGEHFLQGDELVLTEKGDGYVLQLTDEEWNLISNIQLSVFVDDGEGYIDLGQDDVYDYDEDGDLIADFDYTWVTLGGVTAAFYSEEYMEDGDYFRYTGYVPALVNGEEAQIVLVWDSLHKDGYVAGVRPDFSEDGLVSRGLAPLFPGDEIQMLCDYYQYDGTYDAEYEFGEPFTVQDDLAVTYADIGNPDTLVSYRLTDIYGNVYWTESLTYQ